MNWRFFVGASILAGGLMLKVAPIWAVAAGLALAALVKLALEPGGPPNREKALMAAVHAIRLPHCSSRSR